MSSMFATFEVSQEDIDDVVNNRVKGGVVAAAVAVGDSPGTGGGILLSHVVVGIVPHCRGG